MAENLAGAVKPSSIEQDEHLTLSGVGVKRVLTAGYDGTNLHDLTVDSGGRLLLSSLIPYEYDNLVLGYTGSDLTSVVYKKGVTTVATLTLGYTDSKLTSIART